MTLPAELGRARSLTDEVFARLDEKALLDRPIPERHRFVFYLGHIDAFDWNLIGRKVLELPSFDPALDALFAFGIDPVDGSLPDDTPGEWPARDRVESYVRRVRATLDAEARNIAAAGHALDIAIEHRLMHAETLAYMLHALPFERKHVEPAQADPAGSAAPEPRTVVIPAGRTVLGRDPAPGPPFGWDNEYPALPVDVEAFEIDVHDVTCAQYAVFIRSGGYRRRELWSDEDWAWKERLGLQAPHFWERQRKGWWLRTAADLRPLPKAWPVWVSHAEASAYARWRGRSLPTEAQYHRAAFGQPGGGERDHPWGSAPPDASRGNFGGQRWDPVPVGSHPLGASAFGVEDLVGNGWEWTSTVFAPFTGFASQALYPSYSQGSFDGRHYVLKGAGPRTDARLIRKTFRNWFQPRYPWVHAAFRLVNPLRWPPASRSPH